MPSWNIHIAQTERLLATDGAFAHAVRDRNAFVFGNVVPDIPVGYMVPGVAEPIPYRITHFADAEPIPKPREHEFWRSYVEPLLGSAPDGAIVPAPTIQEDVERLNRVHYPMRYADAEPLPVPDPACEAASLQNVARSKFDLTLGVWTHLVADNVWNARVNEFLDSIGGKPSEEFRIKKQGDFDWFGKTLAIHAVPRATERLLKAAASFDQYTIGQTDALTAIGVIHEIVRGNPGTPDHAPYRLLTDEFFVSTFEEVLATTERLFAERTGC